MKKLMFLLLSSNLMITSLMAQANVTQIDEESINYLDDSILKHNVDIGVGLGCDYAGVLGLKLSYVPNPYFSLFVSGGFAMFEFTYNVGATYHIIPKTSKRLIRPHIKAMYGYNEIIILFDNREYDQLYYGFTPGIGVEFRTHKSKNRGFDFDLNFPFRSEKFKDDFKKIDENPDVDIKKPFPIAFAIGYHWEF